LGLFRASLVGLYFAVASNPDLPGEVVALNALTKAGGKVTSGSPFEIKRPTKLYSKILSPRIRAQEGLFVACSHPTSPLDDTLRFDWKLQRYVVPSKAKPRLLYELYRLGVHQSSLFPDIDGLAARIKWQHSVDPLSKS
jgi:hypothetical protein